MSDRIIPLTEQDYAALERAMQWPEDLPKYDRIAAPTRLTEISFEENDSDILTNSANRV